MSSRGSVQGIRGRARGASGILLIGLRHGIYSWQSVCKHFPTMLYK